MRVLRIIYVWDADYPWDVRTEKICLALAAAGHAVHIVARNKGWNALTESRPEGLVHRMKPWKLLGQGLDTALSFPAFFSPRWRGLLRRTIRDYGADLIIVRDLPLCPAAIAVGRNAGIPVMLDMAEHYPAIMRELWTSGRNKPFDWLLRNPKAVQAVEAHCLARAHHVLTVVEESSQRLESQGVPAARLSVVGNTPPRARVLDVDSVNRRHTVPRKTVDLVYLGLLEVSRGIGDLIDAARELAGSATPVRIILLGSGRDESIFRNHAKQSGLDGELVVFEGFVPYAEAMERIADADIGLLPIHVNEHMNTTVPNKLFDYMSVGIPVITSNSIPSERIVRETGCGEVFRARDVGDLVKAISRLRDPAVRMSKGEAGRQAILSRYNWDRDAAVLLAAVQESVK